MLDHCWSAICDTSPNVEPTLAQYMLGTNLLVYHLSYVHTERENEQLRSALCDNDQTETIQPSSGQPHIRSSSQPSQDLLQESLEFQIASESPEDLDSPQNVEEDFEFASQIRHRHMRQEQQT